MMNIPFAFVIVSANENLKVFAKPKDQSHPFMYYFGCAFLAGMVAGFATNPMDVIKTRLNIQNNCSCLDEGLDPQYCTAKNSGQNPAEDNNKLLELKYKDIKDVVSKIYYREGVSGFLKGVIPRMLMVAPGVSISWGTYEIFKSILDK